MPSPWRPNLDSAFPPFIQGAPVKSVYERAGFDVNKKSPTESTYAESIRSSASQRSRKSSRVSSRHTNYPELPSPVPPLPSTPRLGSSLSNYASPSVSRATTPMGYNPLMSDPSTANSMSTFSVTGNTEQNVQPKQAQPKEYEISHGDHQQGSEISEKEHHSPTQQQSQSSIDQEKRQQLKSEESKSPSQQWQPTTRPNSQASSIYSYTHDPILLAKSPPISSDRTKSLLPYQKEQQELQKLQARKHFEQQKESLEETLNNISTQKKIPPPLNLDDISNTSTKEDVSNVQSSRQPLDLFSTTEDGSAFSTIDNHLISSKNNSFKTILTTEAPSLAHSPMLSESSNSPTTSNDDEYNSARSNGSNKDFVNKSGVLFDMAAIASRSNSVSSNATTASTTPTSENQHFPAKVKRKIKGICRECNSPIIGKSVGASDNQLSGRWHKHCFCCMECKSFDFQRGSIPSNNDYMGMSPPKTNEFYVRHDRPLCHACYHTENMSLCKACNAGIEGGCLDDGVSRYHVGCVRCTDCDTQLDPQRGYISVVAGRFYCPRHAELEVKLRESQLHDNQGETPVVEKRRTQLLMM